LVPSLGLLAILTAATDRPRQQFQAHLPPILSARLPAGGFAPLPPPPISRWTGLGMAKWMPQAPGWGWRRLEAGGFSELAGANGVWKQGQSQVDGQKLMVGGEDAVKICCAIVEGIKIVKKILKKKDIWHVEKWKEKFYLKEYANFLRKMP
jgi:hypothetical protein